MRRSAARSSFLAWNKLQRQGLFCGYFSWRAAGATSSQLSFERHFGDVLGHKKKKKKKTTECHFLSFFPPNSRKLTFQRRVCVCVCSPQMKSHKIGSHIADELSKPERRLMEVSQVVCFQYCRMNVDMLRFKTQIVIQSFPALRQKKIKNQLFGDKRCDVQWEENLKAIISFYPATLADKADQKIDEWIFLFRKSHTLKQRHFFLFFFQKMWLFQIIKHLLKISSF